MGRQRYVVGRDSKNRWLVVDTTTRSDSGKLTGIVCSTRSEARRRTQELNWQRAEDNAGLGDARIPRFFQSNGEGR